MGAGREVRKFSKQECWSERPSPSPGAFAQPTDPTRFCTAGRFFTQPPGKPKEEAISQEVWNGMGGWGGRGTCWEGGRGRGPRPSQECGDRGNFRIFNESFWLCWVFVAAEAGSGCGERRCSARTAHCAGFSCGARAPGTRGLQPLWRVVLVVTAARLWSAGSMVGARAHWLLRGRWDLPRPGT